MTKEVLLFLKGLQFETNDADGDKIETITAAEYYKRNSSHYVIYDEVMEGFDQNTKNIIKFQENTLDLTKRGLVNVHMVFEKNKKNMTSYSTPYGNILVGIDTNKIHMQEEEARIRIDVDYALEINYEHFADCKIRMDIRAKEACSFSLNQ